MKRKFTKAILSVLSIMMLVGCGQTENPGQGQEQGQNNEKFIEVPEEPKDLPIATIEIEGLGTIKAELYPHKAPNTVNNFIDLANSGYYDGLIFHRIIAGFMVQGGCPLGQGTGNPGYSIAGEFSNNGFEANDIKHTEGILSMARSQNADSAGSQFFIMTGASPHLDGDYAAFGNVIEGLDVVMQMNVVKTGDGDRPVEDVTIKSITVDTKGQTYEKPVTIK